MEYMFIYFAHKVSNSYKGIQDGQQSGKTNFAKHISAKIAKFFFLMKSMQINLLQEFLLLIFTDNL